MNRRITGALLLVAGLTGAGFLPLAGQGGAGLGLRADRVPQPGESFSIEVVIDSPVATRAAQFGLAFDPLKLRCDEAELGPFYDDWAVAHGGASALVPAPRIDNARGIVSPASAVILGGAEGGPSGQGVTVIYHFTALASGLAELSLTEPLIVGASPEGLIAVPDVEAKPLTIDIISQSSPEPGASSTAPPSSPGLEQTETVAATPEPSPTPSPSPEATSAGEPVITTPTPEAWSQPTASPTGGDGALPATVAPPPGNNDEGAGGTPMATRFSRLLPMIILGGVGSAEAAVATEDQGGAPPFIRVSSSPPVTGWALAMGPNTRRFNLEVESNRPWSVVAHTDGPSGWRMVESESGSAVPGGDMLHDPLHVRVPAQGTDVSEGTSSHLASGEGSAVLDGEFFQQVRYADPLPAPGRTYQIIVTFTGYLDL